MDKIDETSLESAIRDEAKLAISAIARKEAEELKRLDDAYASGLDNFKNRQQAQTDARIRQESFKAESKTTLNLKKLKLKGVEEFINRTVEGAAKGIRNDPQYKKFLLDTIIDTACRIQKAVEVRLKREDLIFEKEIRAGIKAACGGRDIGIVEDKAIKWGGSIICDVSGGCIFDGTIERIYYRKTSAIRQEVMRLLEESSGDVG
jgi:vacuolar-type H+-ATPase subunit E/Vma4